MILNVEVTLAELLGTGDGVKVPEGVLLSRIGVLLGVGDKETHVFLLKQSEHKPGAHQLGEGHVKELPIIFTIGYGDLYCIMKEGSIPQKLFSDKSLSLLLLVITRKW